MTASPLLVAAAEGQLPSWSRAGTERIRHMRRVADLMETWSSDLADASADRVRWRAAGMLHDVLRDEDPEVLRSMVPVEQRALPGSLLHGPAAAVRLRDDGVRDEAFLRAIAYHTMGHPMLDLLGRSLYAADFLDPGRPSDRARREAWTRKMPRRPDRILVEVTRARITSQLERSRPLLPETVGFWNTVLEDADG